MQSLYGGDAAYDEGELLAYGAHYPSHEGVLKERLKGGLKGGLQAKASRGGFKGLQGGA